MVVLFAAFPHVCKFAKTQVTEWGRSRTDHSIGWCLISVVLQVLKMHGSHFLRCLVIVNEYVGIV